MEACLQVRRQEVQSLLLTGFREICFCFIVNTTIVFAEAAQGRLCRKCYPTNFTQPNVSAILPV